MVDESLLSYLGNNELTRSLLSHDFQYNNADAEQYTYITAKLKALKVLDPACGSGAFPMGMMNRIVDILKKLNPQVDTYQLKLHVIEHCIYGSDKQCIAAQITKLRFFISLICDCNRDESKPNFGIPTLPNLETKFVVADTLIAIKRSNQPTLFEGEINEIKSQLQQVRQAHFEAKNSYRKIALRKQDEQLREQLAKMLQEGVVQPSDAMQLAKWNPYDQNAVAPFFDPEWMFNITSGFDIVIGNPPYIQLQKDNGKLAKLYENEGYTTFARTGDIYCLFYERGWQLLKVGGHLCYITSNKWMRAGYGQKTRAFFTSKTNPMLLIDFAGIKIFDATVDTNILLFAKGKNQKHTVCAVASKANSNCAKNMSLLVRRGGTAGAFEGDGAWVVLTPH